MKTNQGRCKGCFTQLEISVIGECLELKKACVILKLIDFFQEGDDDSEDEEHETMNGNVSRGGDLRDDDDDVSDPVNVSS